TLSNLHALCTQALVPHALFQVHLHRTRTCEQTPSKAVTLPKPKKSSSSGSNSNSGRNTPTPSSTPRPPNFLLPTWGATLHTLPQSLPSSATPSEGSRLSRAVHFLVSRILSPTIAEHNHTHDHDRKLRRHAERYVTFGCALLCAHAPPTLLPLSTPSTPSTPTPATPASAKSWLGTPKVPPRMGDKDKTEMEDVLQECMGEAVLFTADTASASSAHGRQGQGADGGRPPRVHGWGSVGR
ncbi:hypothetical protein H0H87_012606, partial [Tephrocybe sp. NHM501043]